MNRTGFLDAHTMLFFACLFAISAGTALVVHHVPSLVEVADQLRTAVVAAVPYQ